MLMRRKSKFGYIQIKSFAMRDLCFGQTLTVARSGFLATPRQAVSVVIPARVKRAVGSLLREFNYLVGSSSLIIHFTLD